MLECSCLRDVFKGLIDLTLVVQQNGERGPENSLSWKLLRSLAQQVKRFLSIVEADHAAALDVERVDILLFAALLSLLNILEGAFDVAMAEAAPG